ncbi:PREDICTED: uncharacterized protein LOC109588473 [Amphimedon queenslandica]|uniref:C-terminal of Roc (COR) domain-containing protein n=2 Tax=Amphimedon queenslandica TaxID=400682 RepID=A0AAN0JTI5_AMPQE|nr:PREDICTED: uncharacterized protein LOC109588473 [Amphimedon queenslandica]|eukprot:XP_019860198.1 PREDICTED: uncharacterized protein LOC109588473 [Amphimedon queenslandica]
MKKLYLITRKLLPANNTSNETTRLTAPHQSTLSFENTEETSSFKNQSRSPEEIDLSNQYDNASVMSSSSCMHSEVCDVTSYNEESSNMEHENIANSCRTPVNCEVKETKTDTKVQNSDILSLLDYVKKIPERKRQRIERKLEAKGGNHTMLHIIDTGGQPEFHEILPALITGPAINLLVFKLTEDLRSRYKIIYRTSAGDSEPYETSLTHEEVIFRSLASIACLRQNTIGWSFDEVPIEDKSEPVAFLIATHRDQVDENKVNEVNEQLQTKIKKSSDLFNENLVQFSKEEQVIFPLDTTKDEEKVEHLRFFLHQVISQKFQELKIPAPWCIFSLKLRKSTKKLFHYDSCFNLGKECGIQDTVEFKNVLWYLHHRVGIIMHYPNVAGLEDVIITDLQLVFDRITNLITTCFTFEQSGSAAVGEEFRKNGRFSESQLDEMSSREKGDPLNTKKLVALLKHLYIVAGPMKTKVGRKTVKYYFMPCALKPADVEKEERNGSVSPAPLLICFECGYTPVGVFCCLVVYLLDQKTDQVLEWKLTGNDQYRNRITFQVGQYYDTVTLISCATYLEVWVQQIKGSKLSTSELLSSLDKGVDIVTQSLHYTYKSKHMFGVQCTCTAVPHPAVIGFNEEATKCVNGRIVEFNEKQLYWSTKVVKLNNTTQNTSCEIPSQTESHVPKSFSFHDTAAIDTEVCPRDLFRQCSADITHCVSLDVVRVADRLFAAKVIPEALRNEISSLTGLDDYRKANKMMVHIQNILSSYSNPTEYLTDVCYALLLIDNETLKHILNSILKELGKPQESKEDMSKSSNLKRPRAAQENASASKRFEIDTEGSYHSTKSTFVKEQSSGSRILQNERRGRKRQIEDISPGELTDYKIKKAKSQSSEIISLLSDDDDVLILDSPPPSPSDKGHGKRSIGNKPHRRKTGSKK